MSTLWCYRVITWSVLAVGFAFAAVVLSLRYWVLPNVEHYREDIARVVSERARQKITIGRISANWDGLRPQLVLEQVTVHDNAGRPALELARVDNTFSWLSLATLRLRFYSLYIHAPTLNIRRDAKGALSVAGIEVTGEEDGGGFADWLIYQRRIEIDEATVVWRDELRGAPPLELRNVRLQIVNRVGGTHEFGLRAVPPAKLAGPLDVRGNLTGRTVRQLADWNGRFFLDLDYADIAAWRTWVTFPVELPRGTGGVRAWLTFSHDQLTDAIVDLKLANVRTRLEQNLPELEVTELSGRLGWKKSGASFEVTTTALKLATPGGLALPPIDFALRYRGASGSRPERGELAVNALEFAPLAALADHLPLPAEARRQFAALAPRGQVHEVQVRWSGDWRHPAKYSAKGRFEGLAMNAAGRIPGFKGVSGAIEGSERGGTLQLNSQSATVEMPLVFREPLQFDVLAASVGWTRSGAETEVRLNNISFSNSHVAGSVFGNYRTAGDTRGVIDLTGNLTRADARFASRYVPLAIGQRARDWLDAAFLSGQSSEVSLRLKGNLDDFPFADGQSGIFQVAAKVTGATIHYANGWPRIEAVAGDLLFRGARMDVLARQATVLGVRLSGVRAEIPDLKRKDETLIVSGEAEGPTREFLSFIDKSPVQGMIDNFTEQWQVQGSGKLTLRLEMVLGAVERAQVAGAFQFAGNTILADPDLPPVEQATGRIEFTESSVRSPGITGTFAGGPITLTATTQRDSTVRVVVQGRVNTENVRRAGQSPLWLRVVSGSTDWRAIYTVQKRVAEVVIESDLQGLASDLPAPLRKAAADVLPLRYERRALASGQDRLVIGIGDIVTAQLVRSMEGRRTVVPRGSVRFGGTAAEPERDGIWVTGTVRALDLDGWIALTRAGAADARLDWGGIELKADTVDLFGRRFNQLNLTAVMQGGFWRGTVAGRELEGNASWEPQGKGRLVARMKTMTIPASVPTLAAPGPAGRPRELPAIDLVAEQFVNKDKQLGRLELLATPGPDSWRIERLRITNPDATFAAEGMWQTGLVEPRTQVSLRLESPDAGKLLARLGYPEGMRNGRARLEGALSWTGPPYDFDYPSLAGSLLLEVQRGQFTKLDPGIGKLLGILSLQALPRRLTLDFRDIFSDGLAFDDIVSAIKIDRGVASTESFRIQGPSARIVMAGEVDLARETQKLRVKVSPSVSDGVSIAGALIGGPIAGVAAFLAQKILKDPLNEMVAYEYAVTGTWAEPHVVRADRQAAGAPEGERQ
ncbi:MAG: TIGR02099 family protein [Burkholderiales bacterium]|nr:TIGR02099 family protein [Burkholderiales bacterium]